jgi:hypothetical protein
MKDARQQLQARLDAINMGKDQTGANTLRALATPAAPGRPHVGRYLTLLNVESVMLTRVGQGILMKAGTKDEATQQMLDLVNLLGLVGPDRVRQCPLVGCGNWFVARKGQRWCTLEHSNRGAYEKWRAKHKKRRRGR